MPTSTRNAELAKTVSIPYSKIKMEIAKVLAKEKIDKEADHKAEKPTNGSNGLNYGDSIHPRHQPAIT